MGGAEVVYVHPAEVLHAVVQHDRDDGAGHVDSIVGFDAVLLSLAGNSRDREDEKTEQVKQSRSHSMPKWDRLYFSICDFFFLHHAIHAGTENCWDVI